jgi:hypothetical protein
MKVAESKSSKLSTFSKQLFVSFVEFNFVLIIFAKNEFFIKRQI